MGLADILSILAIVISIATAFFTAYEQYWKKPQLSLVLGDSISLTYGYEGIALWACVVVANQGAEDAVILRIDGTLTRAGGGWESQIGWLGFGKYKDQAPPGKPFEPLFAFIDWAEALISPSRKASTSWIAFSGPIPGKLTEGLYSLQLNVVTQGKRHGPALSPLGSRTKTSTACYWTGSFKISKEGAEQLEQDRVGTPKHVGTFKRVGTPKLVGMPKRMVSDTYAAHLTGNTTKLLSASPTATLGGIPRA